MAAVSSSVERAPVSSATMEEHSQTACRDVTINSHRQRNSPLSHPPHPQLALMSRQLMLVSLQLVCLVVAATVDPVLRRFVSSTISSLWKINAQTEQLLAHYKIRQVERRLLAVSPVVDQQPSTVPLSTVFLVIAGTCWYFTGLFFAVAIWSHLVQMEMIIMEEEMDNEEWTEVGGDDVD